MLSEVMYVHEISAKPHPNKYFLKISYKMIDDTDNHCGFNEFQKHATLTIHKIQFVNNSIENRSHIS